MAKLILEKVDCKYGAPMGRLNCYPHPACLYLQKVPMVDGDYDSGGAYWGGGSTETLWCAFSSDNRVRLFERGKTRNEAKSNILRDYPVTFYK